MKINQMCIPIYLILATCTHAAKEVGAGQADPEYLLEVSEFPDEHESIDAPLIDELSKDEDTIFSPEDFSATTEHDLLDVDPEYFDELLKEFGPQFLRTQNNISACPIEKLPLVWREFSPFFKGLWTSEFVEFAALFLAIWRRESFFALPSTGVLVQPHCRKLPPRYVKTLPGKDITTDLMRAKKRDRQIEAWFPRCSMRRTDYGALQWNYKWRISNAHYRPQLERALLLSSRYKPQAVRALPQAKLNQLVKYNAKTLFVLAGISLIDGAKHPQTTIRNYNSDPEYFPWVDARRLEYLNILKTNAKCGILFSLPK